MDDVRGDFLGPSLGTAPSAVSANKKINVSSFESNEDFTSNSWINLKAFYIKDFSILKWGQKAKCCLEYDIDFTFKFSEYSQNIPTDLKRP